MINHPRGDMMFTFTADGTVHVWDLNSDQIVQSKNLATDFIDNKKQLSVLPTSDGNSFFTVGSAIRSFHMQASMFERTRTQKEKEEIVYLGGGSETAIVRTGLILHVCLSVCMYVYVYEYVCFCMYVCGEGWVGGRGCVNGWKEGGKSG